MLLNTTKSAKNVRQATSWLWFYVFCCAILLCLPACEPVTEPPWEYADLRALDPADAETATDIIAIYTRASGSQTQLRIDFLDFPESPASDIYLAFDTRPGGFNSIYFDPQPVEAVDPSQVIPTDLAYDLLVVIPAGKTALRFDDGQPVAGQTALAANIDPALDTLTLYLEDLPKTFSLQAYTALPGHHTVQDRTAVIFSDSAPPPPARFLLAFEQAFPAVTPAQTLRRWDGAHTGPYGERHGLKNLLLAAENHRIPLALLDLKTPPSLSALETTGGLNILRRMARNQLLILPDVYYGDSGISLTRSTDSARAFNLPASDFLYGSSSLEPGYRYLFAPLPEGLPAEQATPDGLTLQTRLALINAAFNQQPHLLGGSLPNSTWGDYDASLAAFDYMAAHPWMQALDAKDLLNSNTIFSSNQTPAKTEPALIPIYNSMGNLTGLDSIALKEKVSANLQGMPANGLATAAWDMYFALTEPVDDPALAALKAQYLGDINILAAASQWAESPGEQKTCGIDLNLDLIPDCVSMDQTHFAYFSSDGGRLAFLFWRKGQGAHQIIAPTYQFAPGLSDRSLWQPELGAAGDPHQVPGAFVDTDMPWKMMDASISDNGVLVFSSPDGSSIKTFQLTRSGLLFENRGLPLSVVSSLALDPWQRYEPNWYQNYVLNETQTGEISWQLRDGPAVQWQATGGATAPFNSSSQFLFGPEDPNQQFSPGHLIPYPLLIAETPLQGGASLELKVK